METVTGTKREREVVCWKCGKDHKCTECPDIKNIIGFPYRPDIGPSKKYVKPEPLGQNIVKTYSMLSQFQVAVLLELLCCFPDQDWPHKHPIPYELEHPMICEDGTRLQWILIFPDVRIPEEILLYDASTHPCSWEKHWPSKTSEDWKRVYVPALEMLSKTANTVIKKGIPVKYPRLKLEPKSTKGPVTVVDSLSLPVKMVVDTESTGHGGKRRVSFPVTTHLTTVFPDEKV